MDEPHNAKPDQVVIGRRSKLTQSPLAVALRHCGLLNPKLCSKRRDAGGSDKEAKTGERGRVCQEGPVRLATAARCGVNERIR